MPALTDDFTNLARRHHADADKAYQTAVRLVDGLALTDKERKLFDEKEHELRLLLAEFGSQNR